MWDIITFGSATQDIYLKSKKFIIKPGKSKKICLPVDSKMRVDEIIFTSGGGGTNTAATLANFGYKVAYCGMLGQDYFADLIIKDLKKFKIDTRLIKRTKEKPSNTSVVLNHASGEKTILVYRGASDFLKLKDIPFDRLKKVKWFYLAPFAQEMTSITLDLVNFAKKNDIKVILNPGYNQLVLPKKILKDILGKVDILVLNGKEAMHLTGSPDSDKAFAKLIKQVKGICIMTLGGRGVKVSDGKYVYQAKSLSINPVDTTGAGDSFASGFLAEFIKKGDVLSAIQLGVANSCSCLKKLGAKNGLLSKSSTWPKVKVKKELL